MLEDETKPDRFRVLWVAALALVRTVGDVLEKIDGRPALTSEADQATGTALDENLFRPLAEGHWAGEDARDVLLEAIEWWERELAIVDGGPCPSQRR